MANSEGSSDPLGKLINRYDTKAKALAHFIAGLLALVAAVALVLFRREINEGANDAFGWRGVPVFAGLVALLGVYLVAEGVIYRGRAFEVRKGGVRYTTASSSTGIAWGEVRKMQVWENVIVQDGRVASTRWKMQIVGDGEEIRLSASFLNLVSSVPQLLKLIEDRSGVPFKHTGDGAPRPEPADEGSLSAAELLRREGQSPRRKKRRDDK